MKADKEEEEFPNEVVLEVRAGAGGDEASLFALELMTMYERFADHRGWNSKHLDEYTLEIKGKDVYKLLRYETGVHRVQRIPATEKNGRIHTSTASVAILPIRKKSKIVINPADLDMEELIHNIISSLEDAERMAGVPVNHVFVGMSGSHIEAFDSRGVIASSGFKKRSNGSL
jgi:peptide chain release factor 1